MEQHKESHEHVHQAAPSGQGFAASEEAARPVAGAASTEQEAPRMDPAIKARWVAALRSGNYAQTENVLKNNKGFCCLGVLCDLYAREHEMPEWTTRELGASDGEDEEPNQQVREWAGLESNNPKVDVNGVARCVSALNDGDGLRRHTFAEIADAIEAQL